MWKQIQNNEGQRRLSERGRDRDYKRIEIRKSIIWLGQTWGKPEKAFSLETNHGSCPRKVSLHVRKTVKRGMCRPHPCPSDHSKAVGKWNPQLWWSREVENRTEKGTSTYPMLLKVFGFPKRDSQTFLFCCSNSTLWVNLTLSLPTFSLSIMCLLWFHLGLATDISRVGHTVQSGRSCT